MSININLKKDSSFNNKEHFFYCLNDLINEWEEVIGPKEMDLEDAGFNCDRLKELKAMIKERLLNEAARRTAKEYILKHGQDLGINKKHLDNKLEIIIG